MSYVHDIDTDYLSYSLECIKFLELLKILDSVADKLAKGRELTLFASYQCKVL